MHLFHVLLALLAPSTAPDVHVDGLRGFRVEVPDGWRVEQRECGSEVGDRLTRRAPVLRRAGRGTDERLRGAIDLLLEHAPIYAAETGKALAHAGPYIVGCHYLLFDYAHAAQAQTRLPDDPAARTRLAELVLSCRLADGSFLDDPVVGRSYATAMAVLALSELVAG